MNRFSFDDEQQAYADGINQQTAREARLLHALDLIASYRTDDMLDPLATAGRPVHADPFLIVMEYANLIHEQENQP
ncbi:hypothetical protein KQI63_05880 [bacterium]|nr:hypothetical protein [bacterium]